MTRLGWKPSEADDQDIWMRLDEKNGLYDYFAFYVDDFIVLSMNPSIIVNELTDVFTIKEIGKPGADVTLRDGFYHFSRW